MGSDATEAALGLLGLTGSIHFSAAPASTSTPTIPLKRKASSSTTAASTSFSLPLPSHSSATANGNGVEGVTVSEGSDAISCICGFTYDDGFSIACDDCSRWAHAACFDIVEGEVPDEWRCWVCEPRKVDKERAVRLQRARQRQLQDQEAERLLGNGKRRVNSPGVDRRRRASAATVDGTTVLGQVNGNAKRKRRYSVNTQHSGHQSQQHHLQQQVSGEDEHVDIDEPMSASHTYIHIDHDLIPHQHTRDKLKRLAQHWRGVTALDGSDDNATTPVFLNPDAFQDPPPTSLRPLPRSAFSHPTLSSNTNPYVRPQSYAVHTTQPIPSATLITPYTSTIVPSTVYLSDPLNSYAHLGMPKPFVHLIGPPLDVALDARLTGNSARFVRSGCRPNAVLRPFLCRSRGGDSCGPAEAEDSLAFGVFALRDLKAHEEVVLGWEWDDGSVIHHLPALIDNPHLFAPSHFEHFRHQMTSMLHALSSTFTTCACGSKARDCAVSRLAEFVDGSVPPTPSPSPPSQYVDERTHKSNHIVRQRESQRVNSFTFATDLGPLIGAERGFRTRERVPMSGGMSGVEMISSVGSGASAWGNLQSPDAGPSKLPQQADSPVMTVKKVFDRKGKGRATEDVVEILEVSENRRSRRRSASPRPQSPKACRNRSPISMVQSLLPQREELLPPKLRKKWIHQNADALRETSIVPVSPRCSEPGLRALVKPSDKCKPEDGDHMDVDEAAKSMPPPPVPASLSPPSPLSSIPNSLSPPASISIISPTASFANLSLLSPLVNGPAPHFPGSFSQASPPSGRPMERRSYFSTVIESQRATSSSPQSEDESILGSPFARRVASPSPSSCKAEVSTGAEPRQMLGADSTGAPLTAQAVAIAVQVDLRETNEDVVMEDDRKADDDMAMSRSKLFQRVSEERSSHQKDTTLVKNVQISDGSVNDAVLAVSPLVQRAVPSADAVDGFVARQSTDIHMEVESEAAIPEKEGLHERADHEWADNPARSTTPGDEKQPPADVSSSPPPQPKVKKISLKDFALRKKKQREEEEQKAHVSATASPVVATVSIGEEPTATTGHLDPEVADKQIVTLPEALERNGLREGSVQDMEQQASLQQATAPDATPNSSKPGLLPVVEVDTVPQVNFEASSVSLQTKIELVDTHLPNLQSSVPQITTRSPSPILAPSSPPSSSRNKKENEPAIYPPRGPGPQYTHHALTRQLSQEDGEILSPPAAKPLPLAPRAHSPPTHPRGFHSHGSSISSPSRPPPRRPLQPAAYRPQLQNVPISSRPLPSGPRALRGANSSSHYSLPVANRSLGGGAHHAPRAPSADRDRDRMDWERDRGRPGPWSRGRGSGGWR